MGTPSEIETFDSLVENFRRAAECCENLARQPVKGPIYQRFIAALKALETDCRLIGTYRSDMRWHFLGFQMSQAHDRAGTWLRGHPVAGAPNVKLTDDEMHPLFVKLAEVLRGGHDRAVKMRSSATGSVRAILPRNLMTPSAPRGDVYVNRGGLLVPAASA